MWYNDDITCIFCFYFRLSGKSSLHVMHFSFFWSWLCSQGLFEITARAISPFESMPIIPPLFFYESFHRVVNSEFLPLLFPDGFSPPLLEPFELSFCGPVQSQFIYSVEFHFSWPCRNEEPGWNGILLWQAEIYHEKWKFGLVGQLTLGSGSKYCVKKPSENLGISLDSGVTCTLLSHEVKVWIRNRNDSL